MHSSMVTIQLIAWTDEDIQLRLDEDNLYNGKKITHVSLAMLMFQ